MNDKERDDMFDYACFSLLTARHIFHSIGIRISDSTLELVGDGKDYRGVKLPENPVQKPLWDQVPKRIDNDLKELDISEVSDTSLSSTDKIASLEARIERLKNRQF